jgi:hypothetical protein
MPITSVEILTKLDVLLHDLDTQTPDMVPCVNRWRFGAPGTYTLTLFGGTVGVWRLDIAQGIRTARIDLFQPR